MSGRLTKTMIAMLALAGASGMQVNAQPVPPPANQAPQGAALAAPQGALQDITEPWQWPLQVPSQQGNITVFQPQLESFEGDHLAARAAVLVDNGQQQTYGAVWFDSRVATDRGSRTVQVMDVNISRSRFPGADPATEQSLSNTVRQAIVSASITLSLDQLLSMLENVQKEQTVPADLQTAPPVIVFRDHPTVKVQYDGQPRMVQVENSPLLRVANTPFFVVLDSPSKTYFLKGGGRWYSAPDPMGPFHDVAYVPQPVSALATATDYTDPQQALSPSQAVNVEIMTATEPTELIWTDGQPQMGTVPGTGLLYVTNTPSDLFLAIDTQQLYVLLSGRWYAAPNRNGPWTYVPPDQLPPDFARIPANSDKGDVLAQVAGTNAAQDAIADTYVPQTAAIARTNYEQPVLTYDGEPRFEVVENLPVSYCVNTNGAVVLVRGRYYSCYNAVWYECDAPIGRPWALCTVVPNEVYLLPPTCPIYSVRYVHVYGFTNDVVYCGYTPGYTGCYVYNRVVVYGTGYHYRPWIGNAYYPRPCTYGFAPHYNMYVGQWGFNIGLAAGTGGGRWVGEGPHSWGREGLWFGFGGYRPVVRHEDVHVDVFRNAYMDRVRPQSSRPPERRNDVVIHNVYEKRKDVHIEAPAGRRPEPEIARGRETPARGPQNEARRGETPRNDVLTDRSGNVYRKTLDGWETRDGNQWKPSQAPRTQEPARGTEARNPSRGAETPARGVETPARGEDRTARGPDRGNQTPPRSDDRATRGPDRGTPTPARGEERPARGTETPARGAETPSRGAETPARGAPERRGETPTRQPPPAVPPAKSPTPSNQQNPDLNRDYRSRIAADDRLRHYETPSRPERSEPPSRSESPSRPQTPPRGESPARGESPSRSEPPARSSGRDDSPSRSGSNGRGNSTGR